jgi:hypothetical protein
MSEKFKPAKKETREPNPQGSEKMSNRLLSKNDVQRLLDRYESHGLKEEGEFFVIEQGKIKIYFHKWETIPFAEPSDTGKRAKYELIGGTPIEFHIGNILGIKIEDEDRAIEKVKKEKK